jgi:hypothetical protein
LPRKVSSCEGSDFLYKKLIYRYFFATSMKDFQGQRDASANEKNVQLFKG